MRGIITALAILALIPFLSGCLVATVANNTVGAIDLSISQKLAKDCSTLYVLSGDPYCQDRLKVDARDPVYCYRTLGGVDCYSETDPYAVSETSRVAPPMVLTAPQQAETN